MRDSAQGAGRSQDFTRTVQADNILVYSTGVQPSTTIPVTVYIGDRHESDVEVIRGGSAGISYGSQRTYCSIAISRSPGARSQDTPPVLAWRRLDL